MEKTFSIIVPLFNEEENIKPLVENIKTAVGVDSRFLEVILVDDGSRDATAFLAKKLADDDNRIRLVKHERNKGLGAAIRTGLNAARGDFVLYTDADLPFDFNLIPHLFSLASDNCVVAGYRLNRGEGGRRWVLTKTYNFLIWLVFGFYMTDVNFACKIFPKRFLQKAVFDSDGSFIDVEILLEARRCGLKIQQHPLIYYPRTRGLSTLSRPGVILFILQEMFGYTTKSFSDQNSFLGFINESPLAKLAIYSMTAFTTVVLFLEKVWLNQDAAWLLLAIETGIVSLFLGWKTGLLTAFVAALTAETFLLRQNQPVSHSENYPFLIFAILGVVISQIIYQSWIFVQKSLKFNTSE